MTASQIRRSIRSFIDDEAGEKDAGTEWHQESGWLWDTYHLLPDITLRREGETFFVSPEDLARSKFEGRT